MLALRLDNRAMHGARSDLAALQGGGNGSHDIRREKRVEAADRPS